MSGYLRFIFAVCVIYAHFGTANGNGVGRLGVVGFYVLSGFLMTRVLVDRYDFRVVPFALNRFLRLYPLFCLVTIVSITAIAILPDATRINAVLKIPPTPKDWINYLLIVPLTQNTLYRPIPPSWSLGVEIINYAILWAFTARFRVGAYVALLAALTYHLYSLAEGQHIYMRYAPFYSAVLPFSLGAILYHERRLLAKMNANLPAFLPPTMLAVWVALALFVAIGLDTNFWVQAVCYYTSMVLLAFLIRISVDRLGSKNSSSADRFAGDLSYPMFLSHHVVGFILAVLLTGQYGKGFSTFAAVAIATTVFATPLVWITNKFIEPIRDDVRGLARQESRKLLCAEGG